MGIFKKCKVEKASQINFEDIDLKEIPLKQRSNTDSMDLKKIEHILRIAEEKKYQQGGRTTFYLPAGFEFTAFKSGARAGHKALCP